MYASLALSETTSYLFILQLKDKLAVTLELFKLNNKNERTTVQTGYSLLKS